MTLRRVGPYRVERRIGHGAVGEVVFARDERSGAAVALKLLPVGPGFSGDARARFFREAETARRLAHPAIVAVHDVGEDDGVAWIAMEWLDGGDLGAHTRPATLLPLPLLLAFGAQAAEALAFAHRSGVVHRDVKPANLLRVAAGGAVKLCDFGIARIASLAGSAAGYGATRSGMLLGTVAFMSPEQLAGTPVDARSDLYSLGATLYQLASGRLPHEADALSRQMHAIANLPAPDLRTLRPEVGAPLAAVVARLLAKAPAERGGDGDALAAELRALAAPGGPISGALPAGTGESPADPMHNSRQ